MLTFDKASHTSISAGARNGERTKRAICASALKSLPTKDLKYFAMFLEILLVKPDDGNADKEQTAECVVF